MNAAAYAEWLDKLTFTLEEIQRIAPDAAEMRRILGPEASKTVFERPDGRIRSPEEFVATANKMLAAAKRERERLARAEEAQSS